MMGNFDDELPSQAALDAAKQLVAHLTKNGFTHSCYGLYGHRDGKDTTCPGQRLYEEFATWPNWHKECNNENIFE